MIVKVTKLFLGTFLSVVFLNSNLALAKTTMNKPGEEMIMLRVDKTSMTADLSTLSEPAQDAMHLRSFEIAIGKASGDKVEEGDNKTPEGIYFTQKHVDPNSLLKSKYGPHAIPLDFPNPIDRLEGKTGYGIWLHGAGNDERIAKKSVTEGCVAFYNDDITALSDWLPAYQAVVVIARDQSEVNLKTDIEDVEKATNSWSAGWKKRNINQYIDAYDDNFKSDQGQIAAYKAYKKRVFKSYKKMEVKLTDLRIVTHPKYAVSIMNQDFNGDNRYLSNGRKILFWQKNTQGQWKIVSENFERKRFEPLPISDVKLDKIANSGISKEELGNAHRKGKKS